ncbi:MAG: PAS domain-containing protein [Dehalococcoidales bacterium]|nr:PAS domain-containing protein [Dehalococcoidales bacterium]
MRSYAHSGYLWLPFLLAAFIAFLGWYGWRRRSVPGALPFSIACLFAVAWCLGSLLQTAAVNPGTKIFWLRFVTLWQLPMITAATCFVLQYAGFSRWLTRRKVALLAVPPLLFAAFILTDGLHHLVWQGSIFGGGSVSAMRAPVNLVFLTYSYLLFMVNVGVLVWLFVTSPRYRAPVALMLLGQVGARLIFELATRVGFPSGWDLDPFVLGVAFGLYAVALFRFHALDPVPAARAAALEQMVEGMVVVDLGGKIVDANPAAQRTLGESSAKLRGRSAVEFLPMIRGLTDPALLATTAGSEFELGAGPSTRQYRMEVSPLRDRQGDALGHLVLLHDVTEEKEAQARLLEEQGVVATYRERERLARELHDGIGQVLGYVSLQAETARDCCRQGDPERVDALLTRLIEVAQRSHADLRHSILALKATPAEDWSFLTSLENQLDDFRQQYGVQTELVVAEPVSADTVGPATAAQVLRVIQEALSNTRHAGAHNVQVAIEERDSLACIVVSDDGCGFDPAEVARDPGRHFGLAFMSERMEQIGGKLSINSRPGIGTRVMLEAPLGTMAEEPA